MQQSELKQEKQMLYAQSFERLQTIVKELRVKCPWDKKQTIESLRPQTIEELYELTEAITENNYLHLKEELGDVLLHIVFYALIAEEEKQFNIHDVIESVCNKLVNRHPHVYGAIKAETEEEVKRNWEKIKLREGRKSVLAGVPNGLPAITKAYRLQEKAKQIGFEWKDTIGVIEKLQEEIEELKEAVILNNQKNIEDEFGDVLFSLVNYARFIKVDPENALERTNQKFKNRFMQMEELAIEKGLILDELSLEEMDALWDEVKLRENKL